MFLCDKTQINISLTALFIAWKEKRHRELSEEISATQTTYSEWQRSSVITTDWIRSVSKQVDIFSFPSDFGLLKYLEPQEREKIFLKLSIYIQKQDVFLCVGFLQAERYLFLETNFQNCRTYYMKIKIPWNLCNIFSLESLPSKLFLFPWINSWIEIGF